MGKFVFPALAVLIVVGTFFGYIDPTYSDEGGIQSLQQQVDDYNTALERGKELDEEREKLIAQRNSFSQEDRDRLRRLLPDNVDNVRLVLDMDTIAQQYGMRMQNVSIQEGPGSSEGGQTAIGDSGQPFGSLTLNFSVTATYEDFKEFLEQLERSLRIVDVESLSFSAPSADGSGLRQFNVGLRTYWLK